MRLTRTEGGEKTQAEDTAEDQPILDYLRANPNFFQKHPYLLSELELPHDTGNAVSLIEHQVSILRDRNMTLRQRMNELLQAARKNDEIFAKTRSLNLALLEVNSWQELNEVLATHVLVDFEADFVCAHMLRRDFAVSLDHIRNHLDQLPFDYVSGGNEATCTVLRESELQSLFPLSDHAATGSAVILRLKTKPVGALCIGSRDALRFSKEMDTLFVGYIADILSKVMNRLSL
ncbi:MAG TPA: DUF484 domain-containing protein [Gammaproteobacteria bacterium]|nr:DUF484 domain-containing protein [Gammaproteobacteria bacterium]